MTNPELDSLNLRVTSAIMLAEHLPPDSPEAAAAFREVSHIEEAIARCTDPSDLGGAIARRGAITAALSGHDWSRARNLAERYLAEPLPSDLRVDLVALRDEAPPEPPDGDAVRQALGQRWRAARLRLEQNWNCDLLERAFLGGGPLRAIAYPGETAPPYVAHVYLETEGEYGWLGTVVRADRYATDDEILHQVARSYGPGIARWSVRWRSETDHADE
jgi:hypothetical protein